LNSVSLWAGRAQSQKFQKMFRTATHSKPIAVTGGVGATAIVLDILDGAAVVFFFRRPTMKALSIDDLLKWCQALPFRMNVDPNGYLRYATSEPRGIQITVPQEARRAAALAYSLLSVEADDGYYGAFMWFTNWDIGTPEIERCGLRILEQMRRGYGVMASVENAPAQLFRSDELADAHAFLTLPLLFGRDAYFMPHGTKYFAYVRQDGLLFLVTEEDQILQKLHTILEPHHPVAELPSYL
jgi:hypothetical protein